MRIVFVGAVEFSRHCLEAVLREGGSVVGVVGLSPEGRHLHSDYADLEPIARRAGIPFHGVRRLNEPSGISLLRSLNPDILFVFGWSQLISSEILKIPPRGCLGTHPALLPKNRGRHPLIWALVEGLTESGLTFFYLDEGTDSGDILWQKSFPITLQDDARTLQEKIKGLASEAISEFLPPLTRGTAPRIPQNHSEATYWRKRTEKDGEIAWASPSMTSYNLIRALARPYPGAHTFLEGEKVILWKARLPLEPPPPTLSRTIPGTVLSCDGESSLRVRTGDGCLDILDYETPSRLKIGEGVQMGGL